MKRTLVRHVRGATFAAVLFLGAACVRAEDRNQWQQPDRVLDDLALQPGARVADVGCGDGYFALHLARAVGPSGLVYAVDIDADALEKLRTRAAQAHLTNVAIVASAPTDTRLPPDAADAVFICNVLHEASPEVRAPLVRSAALAARPGGYLYLIDWRKTREVPFDPYEKLIPRDDLIGLCTNANLRLDADFHYLKYQVFLRFRKDAPPRP
jgi:ubiquinone/menaquinone biosynthesis C-methylase UbiE